MVDAHIVAFQKYERVVSNVKGDARNNIYNKSFHRSARRLDPDTVKQRMFDAIPRKVKWALGRDQMSFEALKQSTEPVSEKHLGIPGVYINLCRNTDGRKACYVGSTNNLPQRVKTHRQCIGKKSQTAEHYRVLSEDGWSSDFRVLMMFDAETHPIYWFWSEANLMMLIGSLDTT